jgi:hypothetical protein
MCCDFFEERIEFLNIIYTNFGLQMVNGKLASSLVMLIPSFVNIRQFVPKTYTDMITPFAYTSL